MSRSRQKIIATILVVPAGLLLLASAGLLVADHLTARHRVPADKQRIAALEKTAKSDASQVSALAAELDRQTKLSLRRAGRQQTATAVLIVASVLFLSSAKWFISLRGGKLPSLDTIKAVREPAGLRVPGSAELRRGKQGSGFRILTSDESPTPCCARDGAPGPAGDTRSPNLGPGIQTAGSSPTSDLGLVDEAVAREGRGAEAAIPILQAIQSHYGYLPDEALKRVCELTEIRPAQIAGVSTFYAQFRRTPAGKHIIKVCHGTACHVSGARQITEEVRRHLAIAPDSDTDPQRMFTVDKVACLGCCSLAPVIMIDEQTVGRLTPAEACQAIEAFREQEPGT
jgi:NADH:ubiquinone oxidoreductase subunit E